MGEAIGGVPGSPPLSDEAAGDAAEPVPSIGRYLARQRKLRGMELDELVTLTRIPRRSLERLEGGAFDGVTDGFVRGFVRTVASAIGLDPDEAVARMLVEPDLGPRRAWPRAGAVLAAAGAFLLLVALGSVVAGRFGRPAPAAPSAAAAHRADPELRLRRDPVRALAEAQRAAPTAPPASEATRPAPRPGTERESFSPPAPGP